MVQLAEQTQLSGLIFNIMRFATHDGPGIRTAVFLKGCPLSCWWCHNPESQSFRPDRLYFEERCRHCLECIDICPEHAIYERDGILETTNACTYCGTCAANCMAEARQLAGIRYTVTQLMTEIEKDVIFFDESGGGVTLSGGEPVSQPQFSAAILEECRRRGISTAVETCGFAQPETFWNVARLADLVMFDLKQVDPESHKQHTGVSNDLILANLERLVASGRPVTVRIPVIPGINDGPADVARFAEYLSRLKPPAVELLPYHRIGTDKYLRLGMTYKLQETPQPAAEDLGRFIDAFTRANLNVTVGG